MNSWSLMHTKEGNYECMLFINGIKGADRLWILIRLTRPVLYYQDREASSMCWERHVWKSKLRNPCFAFLLISESYSSVEFIPKDCSQEHLPGHNFVLTKAVSLVLCPLTCSLFRHSENMVSKQLIFPTMVKAIPVYTMSSLFYCGINLLSSFVNNNPTALHKISYSKIKNSRVRSPRS